MKSAFTPYLDHLDSFAIADQVIFDSLSRSYFESTVVYESNSDLLLADGHLSGNCMIICQGDVSISNTAQVEGILIYARKVYIDDDFSGSMQIFATDTVFIGDRVHLNYPSVICVSKPGSKKTGSIIAGEACKISGELIALKKQGGRRELPFISLGEKSIFQGLLYNEGLTEIRGTVAGSVTTFKLFLKGKSGSYENTLMNATLSEKNLSNAFLMRAGNAFQHE